jgi:L-lysine 6-transaminase
MSTTAPIALQVSPRDVHDVLKRHLLVDGYHLVQDLDRSHGAFIYDSSKDREVLDFYTSFATIPLGYNHPKLVSAETRERLLGAALNKLANSDIYTTELATFAETFSRTLPEALRHHLFFIEGGTLAVENALKTAFDWKVRKNLAKGKGEKGSQILHFKDAFHGRSGYSLSLTNTADPRKTQYFPKFPWPRVSNPMLSFPVTDEVLARVVAAEKQSVAEIERAVRDNPDDIAALIIEPIQGEGGDNHFRREFLAELRRLADEHEFLLIFDEVQTGFGTTGKWWAFEHFGVTPDIISFGKKTQVCGIAASRRLDEVDSVFKISSRINSTWGGNLVDMVRCTRIVEIVEEDNLLDSVTRVGERLLENLRGLERAFPGKVTNARGRGMFVAFDLPDGDTRKAALAALNEANVLGLASGHRAIRFRPALILSADEADEGVRRVEKALRGLLG